MLLRCDGSFFLKLDNNAVLAGCALIDAFELLFMSFYVFDVDYPSELKIFFTFFEKLFGMKLSCHSALLSRFWSRLIKK